MALHLSKTAVGCNGIADLKRRQQRWIVTRTDGTEVYRHRTRFLPKRFEEILDGGSIYWIMNRAIAARQAILGFDSTVAEGKTYCLIELDPEVVLVRSASRRHHQGWRYLQPGDAPPDLGGVAAGIDQLPPDLQRQLNELALI